MVYSDSYLVTVFISLVILPCFICKLDSDPEKRVARIRHETQIHILNLLITSLELNGPNLGLYLLGYEVKKHVSSTNLQDPGQIIFSLHTCHLVNVEIYEVSFFYLL